MPTLEGEAGHSGVPPLKPCGVWGDADNAVGVCGTSNNRVGVWGVASSSTDFSAGAGGYGVIGQGMEGVLGYGPNLGVYGESEIVGVMGSSGAGDAVSGLSANGDGVVGQTDGEAGAVGVSGWGNGLTSDGVRGIASNGAGVLGHSYDSDAVVGSKSSLLGSAGFFANTIPSESPSRISKGASRNPRISLVQFGQAATFIGHVDIFGNVSVSGGKFFKIDHPLDPANKYLRHSAVESAEMKNIYDGIVTLNRHGAAVVTLPKWCQALNTDFRYQLTSIGAPCSTLYISREIHDGQFMISGGGAGLKVSWQVTGVRRDAWARANPMKVEQVKSKEERGHYLHPELYPGVRGRSVEKTVHPAIAKASDRLRRLRESVKKRQRLAADARKRTQRMRRLRTFTTSAIKRRRVARSRKR